MFPDNIRSGRPVLFMFWICLWKLIPGGRCSPPASVDVHSSDCNASCREHEFCDTIEHRCSPCSARVCQLKVAETECQPFCSEYRIRWAGKAESSLEAEYRIRWAGKAESSLEAEYRIRWAGKAESSLEAALEKMSKSRVPVHIVIVIQLATLLLLATLLFSLTAFYLRYKELLVKFLKTKHARSESTQMIKRNNLDVEMSFLKTKGRYDPRNVCPPMMQTFPTPQTLPTHVAPATFQTSEFSSEPHPRCTCEEEEIRGSSDVDTGSGVRRDELHDRMVPCRNPEPGNSDLLGACSVESRSLLTDCFIQPSPLSQDL